jgi:hypothetical protein
MNGLVCIDMTYVSHRIHHIMPEEIDLDSAPCKKQHKNSSKFSLLNGTTPLFTGLH